MMCSSPSASECRFNVRSQGDLLDHDLRRTKVLGDIANFPDRLRAGTGNGPYGTGGLRQGDSYPDAGHARSRDQDGAEPNSQTFPFKVWEGTLTDGADAAIILPTMWEQDNDGSPFDAWQQSETNGASQLWWDGAVQQALKQTSLGVVAPPSSGTLNGDRSFADIMVSGAVQFMNPLGPIWVTALLTGSRDRPIGLGTAAGPGLPRRAIVLTRETIEHALNAPRVAPDPAAVGLANAWMLGYLDVPVGIIPVVLVDQTIPGGSLDGAYVLYLQVERM